MDRKQMREDIPMKWHTFLIWFVLFFSALSCLASAYNYLNGSYYGSNSNDIYMIFPSLKAADIAMGIAYLGAAIFMIVVRFRLAGFYMNGPRLLTIAYLLRLALEISYLITTSAITQIPIATFVNSSELGTSIIGPIIATLINWVYYKKRAELFIN